VAAKVAGCWLADLPDAGPCSGALVHAHLIPQQLIRFHYPEGAVLVGGRWQEDSYRLRLAGEIDATDARTLRDLQNDPGTWVWGCGGPNGLRGHHGQLDAHRLELPRAKVPERVERFAVAFGLAWWLDRRYGFAVPSPLHHL